MSTPENLENVSLVTTQSSNSLSADEVPEKSKESDEAQASIVDSELSKEIAKLMIECDDVSNHSKYVDFIGSINEHDEEKITEEFKSNINEFVQSSKFIILCCKYNRIDVLKYALNAMEEENASSVPPLNTEQDNHNAFYYAVRVGNIEMIDLLIDRWFRDIKPEHSYKLLAKAYEELKLKKVILSLEVILHVENRLVNFQFDSNNSEINEVKISHEEIEKRIQLLVDDLELFITEFSNSSYFDEYFFIKARFIVSNINILKKYMRSTYNKIPWEEIEFYLITFMNTKQSDKEHKIFIFKFLLAESELFEYLRIFVDKLKIEKENIRKISIDNLSKFPSLKRTKSISKMIQSNPEFKELYKNYDRIRDTYSLEIINQYMDIALSVDEDTIEGQLVISRTLQVIAELMRNNWKSPNMSTGTSRLLLTSLNLRTRKVIINFHNSLSSYAQLRNFENESKDNPKLFTHSRYDFNILNAIVKNVLLITSIHYTTSLLETIVSCETADDVKCYLKTLDLDFTSDWFEQYKREKEATLEEFLEALDHLIGDECEQEKLFVNRLTQIVKMEAVNAKNRFKDNFDFIKFKKICSRINEDDFDQNRLQKMKYYARRALNRKLTDDVSHRVQTMIPTLLTDIAHGLSIRLSTADYYLMMFLINQIFIIIGNGMHNLDWLEEMQNKVYRYKYLPESNLNDNLNCGQEKKEPLKKLNEEYLAKLRTMRILIDADELDRNIIDNQNRKFEVIVEMLVLDIMSILDKSNHLVDNHLMLDQPAPILVGKNLLHYLANSDALADIQMYDPSTALYLNAKKLMSENVIEGNKKIGRIIKNDLKELKTKFNQDLYNANYQEEMYQVIGQGDLEKLKHTLTEGADIYARDHRYRTCLHYAAQGSSRDILEFILDRNVIIDVEDIDGNNPLHIAAKHGRTEIVKSLVEKNVTIVNLRNDYFDTPLHIAVSGGYKEIVEILIQNDSDTSIMNLSGYTPLHLAAIKGHEEILKMLLTKENKNIDDYKLPNDETLLHLAAEYGHSELVKYLISLNADVNSPSEENQVPLHKAAVNGNLEVVKILISNRGNVNAATADGFRPLHFAVQSGNKEVVEIILDHGAEVNSISDVDSYSAIHIAAKLGHHTIVELLIGRGCPSNAIAKKNMTALHFAVLEGHLKVAEILLKSDAKINAKDFNGCTPLHFASFKADSKMIEFLIENGALVNDVDGNGQTPIHVAASAGKIKAVELLVDHGANFNNLLNAKGYNILHISSRKGHTEIVRFLLNTGTDPNTRSKKSSTALILAASSGYEEIVKALIKAGADINAQNSVGYSALHVSTMKGHIKIVQLLISAKVDINDKTTWNMTPLHIAAEYNQLQIATLLLKNNCAVNPIDNQNRTPLLITSYRNCFEITQLLIKHKAFLFYGDKKPLETAMSYGSKDVVDVIINQANINVNEISSDGNTLLHQAVESGHNDIVKSLIAKKADVNALYQRKTPLIVAVAEGYIDIVRTLSKNKADPDIRDEIHQSALEYAAAKGPIGIFKILLRHTRNGINYQSSGGLTLLHYAVSYNQPDIVKYLLKQRADPNIFDVDGQTPLHDAAYYNFEELVKLLLNNGALYYSRNIVNKTPQQTTTDPAIVRVLKATADLCIAVKQNNVRRCKQYILEGAVVDAVDEELATPLQYACCNDYVKISKILLENGASPNVASKNGTTPLHDAARLGNFMIVKYLLTCGAIYNAKTKKGHKPSDLAMGSDVTNILELVETSFDEVEKCNVGIVEKLLEIENYDTMNAVLSACNQNNETLSIVAKASYFPKAKWDAVNAHKEFLHSKATAEIVK